MAGTHQPVDISYIVGKLETTPGTAETLASADFDTRIYEVEASVEVSQDNEASKFASGDYAGDETIMGSQQMNINFRTRLTYSGAVTTEPNFAKYLNGCGLKSIGWDAGSEVAVGSAVEGIGYVSRASSAGTSMTLYLVDVNNESTPIHTAWQVAGAMGNCVMTLEDKSVIINYSFTGKVVDHVDITALALTSPDTTTGEKFLNSGFQIGLADRKISVFSFDLGNEINPVIKPQDATGFESFCITKRNPTFACNPLAVKQATTDDWNTLLTETKQAINLTIPSTSTNWTLSIPVAQLMPYSPTVREGFRAYEQTYRALRNAGSDAALQDEDTFELLQGARS